ncbi:MAG: DNA topoisomerase 3, partial [Myxococcales bacterium]|nr:DNA topoisomerase 3 [Myxococcales bacterium]
MKLVVAEKPSVARDLARVLGAHTKQKGALSGEGWVVTWCIGHLVELEEPEAYDPSWKRWSLGSLPMIPEAFQLRPAKKTLEQWRVVRDLLKRRDFEAVVNACDAGREGELIFRYAHARAKSKLPIERLWISSLTPEAIRAGFRALKPGRAYDGLAAAARCRSEADWLVGLNATRAMTLVNDGGIYSIGRVQTPTLALVVARELEIRAFEPQPFWELSAKTEHGFVAKWRAPGGASRLGSDALAASLEKRARAGLPLVVTHVDEKKIREQPPQLFDLTSLQRAANTRFGYSASRTLQLLQALYEKHKAITYPRTSSRYLASDQRATLPGLVAAFDAHPSYGAFAQRLAKKPLPITKRIVDDAKVTDHHAIIPTGKLPKLAGDEAKVFDLVVRRFLAAFHPDAELRATEVVLTAGLGAGRLPTKPKAWRDTIETALPPPPDCFVARGRVTVEAGWHTVEPPRASAEQPLPALKVGDRVAAELRTVEGKTKPPPRHTDASLLATMETAGKRVEDETLRDAMKECGLGTPATRASIIETLIRRDYLKRDGKSLVAQDKGIALVGALADPTLRSAELTGQWEARLQRIAAGKDAADAFMADVRKLVAETVATLTKSTAPRGPRKPVGTCPRCQGEVVESRSAFTCTACHFSVPRRLASRELSTAEVRDLLRNGKTGVLSGFRSKKKRRFRAALRIEDGEVRFVFPGKGSPPKAAPRPTDDALPTLPCPACGKLGMVAGRRAWGCAHWREGCRFTVPYVIDEKKITPTELRDLLTKGKTRKATFSSGKGRLQLVELRPTVVLEPSSK